VKSNLRVFGSRKIRIYSSFILLIILNLSLNAQTNNSTNVNFWISGGLGVSTIGSLAANANFNLQISNFLFSLRTAGYLESAGMFSGGDEFSDTAILFGIGSKSPKFFTSISAGLAKTDGSRYHGRSGLFSGGKRIPINSVIGFALESKLNIKLSKAFCIGLSPYVNINKEQSFFCLTICLGLGKLN
jgi:hypothetical protein